MVQSIAFFGGSFDPIHFGHINLAIEMMENCKLDQVWFCPAKMSPHKWNQTASSLHRLNMLKLAIQDIPQFFVLENELNREGASFTIDTLEELFLDKEKNLQQGQLHMIIGEDSVKEFPNWHRVLDIIKLVPLLVGKRSLPDSVFSEGKSANIEISEIHRALLKGAVSTRVFDISSTELRKRLQEGKYCEHLMPLKVLDYISEHRLYYRHSVN